MPAAAGEQLTQHFVIDRSAVSLAGGKLLVGGAPVRLLRLTETGAAALGELTRTVAPDSATRWRTPAGAAAHLAHRLVAAGVLHPVSSGAAPPGGEGHEGADETLAIVIPVRNTPGSFGELLSGLAASGCPVRVVDDGSDDGGATVRRLADEHRAGHLRRKHAGGPAAARNTAPVDADFVAFVDADTVLDPADPHGWLWRGVEHLRDPRVALVAPRIRSLAAPPGGAPATGRTGRTGRAGRWVAEYDRSESPLDLGPDPGLVGAGRRLSYVPATAVIARRTALESVGGFDEAMRFGEDVDLVRRLGEAGWLVRYEPASAVWHRARPGLFAMARQRFEYGTAAAPIDRRHPRSVAPFFSSSVPAVAAVSAVSAATALLHAAVAASAGRLLGRRHASARPASGVTVSLTSTAAAAGALAVTASRLRGLLAGAGCPRPTFEAGRLTLMSTVSVTAGLLTAIRRVWWPLFVPALLLRRTRAAASGVLVVAHLTGHGARALGSAAGGTSPVAGARATARHFLLGLVDDAAYGAGVWWGCAREGSYGALVPRVTSRRTAP